MRWNLYRSVLFMKWTTSTDFHLNWTARNPVGPYLWHATYGCFGVYYIGHYRLSFRRTYSDIVLFNWQIIGRVVWSVLSSLKGTFHYTVQFKHTRHSTCVLYSASTEKRNWSTVRRFTTEREKRPGTDHRARTSICTTQFHPPYTIHPPMISTANTLRFPTFCPFLRRHNNTTNLSTVSSRTYPIDINRLATYFLRWVVRHGRRRHNRKSYIPSKPKPASPGFSSIQCHFAVHRWVTLCFSTWQTNCFVRSLPNNTQDKHSIVRQQSNSTISLQVCSWSSYNTDSRRLRELFQSNRSGRNKYGINRILYN